MEVTEKELLRRSAFGDRHAFSVLYTNHLSQLIRYLYLFNPVREDNEEIIQDVFLKIWERKEVLAELDSFKAYVFKVSKNLLLDRLRRNKIEKKVLSLMAPDTEDSGVRLDDELCYKEYQSVAGLALDRLTEKRRYIFELRTKEGLSLDEIADKLKISKSVVKKQYYAASSSIMEYLRNRGEMTISIVVCLILF